MSNIPSQCLCLVDSHGLYEIADTKEKKLKSFYLDQLSKGIIIVFSGGWNEFSDLYNDEANVLAPHISVKTNMKPKYRYGAASIADKLNSGFPKAPYNRNTDLLTASICHAENKTLLTVDSQIPYYQSLSCCPVEPLVLWAKNNGGA
jgi:hypothetical protein